MNAVSAPGNSEFYSRFVALQDKKFQSATELLGMSTCMHTQWVIASWGSETLRLNLGKETTFLTFDGWLLFVPHVNYQLTRVKCVLAHPATQQKLENRCKG